MRTREAGVPGGELTTRQGRRAVPSPDLVRKLALALGFHTADLFVVAGLPVPDDLATAWPTSPWNVGSIVRRAIEMDADQRGRLQALVLVAAAAITNPDGTAASCTPHDFRRLFAIEAVAAGLPVPIAAKLLGHNSIATTQTYIPIRAVTVAPDRP